MNTRITYIVFSLCIALFVGACGGGGGNGTGGGGTGGGGGNGTGGGGTVTINIELPSQLIATWLGAQPFMLSSTNGHGYRLTFAPSNGHIIANGTELAVGATGNLDNLSLSYRANDDYIGNDSFTFVVTTGTQTSSPVRVMVDVRPPITQGTSHTVSLFTNETINLTLNARVNLSNPQWMISTQPSTGSAMLSTANGQSTQLTYNTNGVAPQSASSLTISLSNGDKTATININVMILNRLPSITISPNYGCTPIALSGMRVFSLSAIDPDAQPLQWSFITPAQGNIVLSTQSGNNVTATYTAGNVAGSYATLLSVSDGVSTVTRTLPLPVGETSDIDIDDDRLIEICNATDLSYMRNDLDGSHMHNGTSSTNTGCPSGGCMGYELGADIALQGEWMKVGTNSNPFTAIFDGNGYTISGLMITVATGELTVSGASDCRGRELVDNIGLFGVVRNSIIRNVVVHQPNITGQECTGAIVGQALHSTLTQLTVVGDNDHSTYEVTGEARKSATSDAIYGGEVGGIVGRLRDSRLTLSSSTVTVQGPNQISGLPSSNPARFTGGAVGYADRSYISQVYVDANVYLGRDSTSGIPPPYIGLIIGQQNEGVTEQVWARGEVHIRGRLFGSTNVPARAGGLVGSLLNGVMQNAWANVDIRCPECNIILTGFGGALGEAWRTSADQDNTIIRNVWVFGRVHQNRGRGFYGRYAESPTQPIMRGRNYYNGANPNDPQAIGLSDNELRALRNDSLSGQTTDEKKYTNWSAGFDWDNDGTLEVNAGGDDLLSIYCDNDASGRIETIEQVSHNAVWLYGTDAHRPALNCLRIDLQPQTPIQPEVLNLQAAIGERRVSLQWENPGIHYQVNPNTAVITWTPAGGLAQPVRLQITPSRLSSTTITGLTNDIEYTFTVRTIYAPSTQSMGVQVSATPMMAVDIDGDGLIDISDASGLESIRDDLDGNGIDDGNIQTSTPLGTSGCPIPKCTGYELSGDITLSDNWIPIGNDSTPFRSIFRGNGYVINNLNIDTTTTNYVGLFGATDGADISSLTLTVERVRGGNHVGALIGDARNSTIKDIFVQSVFSTTTITGRSPVGGLIGKIDNSTLIHIGNEVEVRLTNGQYIGGIAGEMTHSNSWVSAVYSSARISIEHTLDQTNAAGGLIGHMANGRLQNGWARMIIIYPSASQRFIGGLVGGQANGTIQNAYAISTHNTTAGSRRGGAGGYITSGNARSIWTSIAHDGDNSGAPGSIFNRSYGFIYLVENADYSNKTDYYFVSQEEYGGRDISNARRYGQNQRRTFTQIKALTDTETRWNNGHSNDPTSQYCDTNRNRIIENSEKATNNRIWDYGKTTQSPIIRCIAPNKQPR